MAALRAYTGAVPDLLGEGETVFDGETARLTWGPAEVPIYISASGPKTLELVW